MNRSTGNKFKKFFGLFTVGAFALFVQLAQGDETSMSNQDRLRAAVRSGQLDTVTELLKKGANPNGYTDISLLSIAIGGGNPEMVELLLKAGTKVTVPV